MGKDHLLPLILGSRRSTPGMGFIDPGGLLVPQTSVDWVLSALFYPLDNQ